MLVEISYVQEDIVLPKVNSNIRSLIIPVKDEYLDLHPKDVECSLTPLDSKNEDVVSAQVSFLTCDGSQEITQILTYDGSHEATLSSTARFLVPRGTIFGQRQRAFLPNDILTVRCRFKAQRKGKISFSPRIGAERKCFFWTFKSFSQPHCIKRLNLESSEHYGDVQLRLKSIDGVTQIAKKAYLKGGESCCCNLKVSVMDVEGKALNHTSNGFRSNPSPQEYSECQITCLQSYVYERHERNNQQNSRHRRFRCGYCADTDAMRDYQWENIMSLYFAADKYEILILREKCSSFLKENLSFSNICEAFVLAKLHQDAHLMSAVYDFISRYDSEVFALEESGENSKKIILPWHSKHYEKSAPIND
ncbi:hypothetical protein AVEN_181570-1 [Araneus ventricosus]|uniref:BTB domain-containing protein n=1 Tax=Araneus ventricosus TaxID=182803 RepID=A0A4Y2E6H2_ARAVE|nr:hypothetical protein AVEN_181570-1 [Araneus ventricosus]